MKIRLTIFRNFYFTAVFACLLMLQIISPLSAQTTMPTATLGVGDAAPPMQIAKWYKGTPVPMFETGHIYVVEFWATWCVPCKKSIPHLTGLAKQYAGKITFIGVDVFEHTDEGTNESIDAKVTPFVTSMGNQMDYTIAAEDADGYMGDHWLKAAAQPGIPTAFVILGDGRIGWIGHPLKLDEVLPKVVAGTWNVDAEKHRVSSEAKASEPRRTLFTKLMALRKSKDYVGMVAERDAAVAISPELGSDPTVIAFTLEGLFNSDAHRAVSYVEQLTSPTGAVATKPVLAVKSVLPVMPNVIATSPMTTSDWKEVAKYWIRF